MSKWFRNTYVNLPRTRSLPSTSVKFFVISSVDHSSIWFLQEGDEHFAAKCVNAVCFATHASPRCPHEILSRPEPEGRNGLMSTPQWMQWQSHAPISSPFAVVCKPEMQFSIVFWLAKKAALITLTLQDAFLTKKFKFKRTSLWEARSNARHLMRRCDLYDFELWLVGRVGETPCLVALAEFFPHGVRLAKSYQWYGTPEIYSVPCQLGSQQGWVVWCPVN